MNKNSFPHKIETSLIITIVGILLLFSGAIAITLIAPSFVDSTWTSPTTPYQVQMYEVVDPNLYISSVSTKSLTRQFVFHIKNNYSLLAFQESAFTKIVAPKELEKYITKQDDENLKLTSRLLMLRKPSLADENSFNADAAAKSLLDSLQKSWQEKKPGSSKPKFEILELYDPNLEEAFSIANSGDTIYENWVDSSFELLDAPKASWHEDAGVVFVKNPQEYRISPYSFGEHTGWRFDPSGERIENVAELKKHPLGFISREELIRMGEHIFAIEGCWYCHTDQTRTLIQDVVLNGSDSFPAPPSSANEYIYQKITFAGTRRIGPDLSRVGVKRPSRDWHQSHFWSPKTASKGSIMPSFRHFFDSDPRGTGKSPVELPNYRFEAIFQYLMTKGTRITPPTEAWWLGKDPVNTIAIIEGEKVLKP